ncbi:MAG: hypothetical protein ACUVS7_19180 [Bryobacteraceae bacterium]
MAFGAGSLVQTQRTACREFVQAIRARASAETREAERLSAQEKLAKEIHQQHARGIETEWTAMRGRAQAQQAAVAEKLGLARQLEDEVDELLRPLYRKGLLFPRERPRALESDGMPEADLDAALAVAREAFASLEEAVEALRGAEAEAARLRLLLAAVCVIAAFAGLVYLKSSSFALLILPLLAGVAVAVFQLDHAVGWLDRFHGWAEQRRSALSSESGWGIRKSYFGGIHFIRELTEGIDNPYVQSGARATATMYFSGSAVALALLTGYVIISIVVVIAVIALVLGGIAWVIAKVLE